MKKLVVITVAIIAIVVVSMVAKSFHASVKAAQTQSIKQIEMLSR